MSFGPEALGFVSRFGPGEVGEFRTLDVVRAESEGIVQIRDAESILAPVVSDAGP